jgi:autotransporter-associated beta strand protein
MKPPPTTALAALLALARLLAADAGAQTFRAWTGAAGADFMDAANWSPAGNPPISSGVGVFGDPAAAPHQPEVTVSTNRSIDGLQFTSGTGGWTIAGAGTLNIVGNAALPEIYGINALAQTAGITTINAVIATGTNTASNLQNWSVGTGGTLAFNGRLIGGAGSTLQIGTPGAGAGTLVLNGLNTRSGPVQFRAGTILLGAADALGTGEITLPSASDGGAGATLAAAAGALTLANALSLGDGATFTIGPGTALAFSGNIANSGTLLVTGETLVSGRISGSGALAVQGRAVLSNNNTFTGATSIHPGAVLQLGAGGRAGSLTPSVPAGGIVLHAGGTLAFDRADAFAFDTTLNPLSGAGVLAHLGTGTTGVTGGAAFAGELHVQNGLLLVSATDALGGAVNTSAARIGAGAVLHYNENNIIRAGDVENNGAVAVLAAGGGEPDFIFAGTLAPGAAEGAADKFIFGDDTTPVSARLAETSVVAWDLAGAGGAAGIDYDAFELRGGSAVTLAAGARLEVRLAPGMAWDDENPYWRENHVYALFNTNNIIGEFNITGGVFSGARGAGEFAFDGRNLQYVYTPAPAVITSGGDTVFTEGVACTFTVRAEGTPPFLYEMRGVPAPPAWLSLDEESGVLRGTPPAGGAGASFILTIIADNGAGAAAEQTFVLNIGAAPVATGSLAVETLAGAGGQFHHPLGVAVDNSGNVYVADAGNHVIRKVTPSGTVSTLAGRAGVAGAANGAAALATFDTPAGVAADGAGNLYIADTLNHAIRKISAGGVVSTLAGLAGVSGTADGATARFNGPQGVAVDAARGLVYVADTENHTVRKIILSSGAVSTLAGLAGEPGFADGAGAVARFNAPMGVAVDGAGVLYIADTENHTVRKITGAGAVGTLAGLAGAAGASDGTGAAARFNHPTSLAVGGAGASVLYVLDTASHTVRRVEIATGAVSTIAGRAGEPGAADGTAAAVRFNQPAGIAADAAGDLYIADTGNHTLRAGRWTPAPEPPVTPPDAGAGGSGGGGDGIPFLAALVFLFVLRAGRIARLKKQPDNFD